MDGVEVGAEAAQEAQQDEGEEEEEQGDRHCGVGDDLQGEDVTVLWRHRDVKSVTRQKAEISERMGMFFMSSWNDTSPLHYLSLGNVHEHGEAGHVVTLTADVGVVPVEHLAAFGGPAACASDPKHADTKMIMNDTLSVKVKS